MASAASMRRIRAVRVRVRARVGAAQVRRNKERKWCAQGRPKARLGGRARGGVEGIPLPPELVSSILRRLPPRYLFRARAVCKAWRRELSSPEFVREYNTCPSGGWISRDAPTLALGTLWGRQPSVAFNTELKRWVRVPTLFFHGENTYLMAQARGLHVYNVTRFPETEDDPVQNTQLVVSNPLTGATQWLPPLLKHTSVGRPYCYCVHLDICEEGAAYKITHIDAHEECVEVYNSRLGSWTVFQAASVMSALNTVGCCGLGQSACVVLSGNAYFAAVTSRYTEIIASFNLEERKWKLVYDFEAAAAPRYALTDKRDLRLATCEASLATCENKLIVVLLGKRGGAGVYSLDMERNLLVHETSLPKRLTFRMVNSRGSAFPVVGQGHYLCSCNPEDGSMVAYDFRTKQWEEWPACPVPHLRIEGPMPLIDVQFGLLPLPDTGPEIRPKVITS